MGQFGKALTSLYVVMVGIYFTFILIDIKGRDDNWFIFIRNEDPFLAYALFLIFFLVNLMYLYFAYRWFKEEIPIPNSFREIETSFFLLMKTAILFIPIALNNLFTLFIIHDSYYFLNGGQKIFALCMVLFLLNPLILIFMKRE